MKDTTKPVQTSLDSFVSDSKSSPKLVQSQEIRDRGSTFFATIFPAKSVQEAQTQIKYLKSVVHGDKPASHEIAAWRCLTVKKGTTGLGGPDDFEMQSGFEDDGEQWAGSRLLKVLQKLAVIDVLVVVSRYYGGIMLGPARFTHIETCAQEVCLTFKRKQELADAITTLSTLNDILDQLRSDLRNLSPATKPEASSSTIDPSATKPRQLKQDYSTLTYADMAKIKRLVTARERSITAVKAQMSKLSKEKSPATTIEG